MDHECLRTEGLDPRYRPMNVLPEFGCLILSPANLWGRDLASFQMDPNPVSTVFGYAAAREGSSLMDVVFGMRQRDSGITNYPIRNRQRTISYAVTVVLKRHRPKYVCFGSYLQSAFD